MIPAQAVEAAAKVHQDLQAKRGHPDWEELGELGTHAQNLRLEYIRAALEAAAPYIAAAAWEEGVSYALPGTSAGVKTFGEMRTANPYRK